MGQQESTGSYRAVGNSQDEAAKYLENLLRFYEHPDFRVHWKQTDPDRRQLVAEGPKGELYELECRIDKFSGLVCCEMKESVS